MRKIYDRFGDVLYCIRDDGSITDKWDVDVVGHLHHDRITDKFDVETLFRIRSDGTVTDKWDVDVVGHINLDGTVADKQDVDRPVSVDMPGSDSSTSSNGGGHFGGVPRHGSYFPDYGPWNLKKTICLLITLIIQAVFILVMERGNIFVIEAENLQSFVVANGIINIVMLANSLVSGIICKIAYYRVGSIISTIANVVIGVYVVYINATSVGLVVIIVSLPLEFWVIRGGYGLSSRFCKKYY